MCAWRQPPLFLFVHSDLNYLSDFVCYLLMFHYSCYVSVFGICVLFFANVCLRPLVACTITAGTLALGDSDHAAAIFEAWQEIYILDKVTLQS